jgi:hypothetical protein
MILITNEVSAQNGLPDVCIVSLHQMEVTDIRGGGSSFFK